MIVRATSRLPRSSLQRALPSQSRTIVTIIHQGHEGWRLSLGRNPTRLDPGMRIMLPFYHTIQEVDMREKSANISDLSAFTSDNVPVQLSGSLFFRVRDSYRACFRVTDFEANVINIGTSAMRSVVGHFSYDEVIGDRNKINTRLHEVIGSSIEKWGVDCTRFEVQTFKPSNREIEVKQLELQMSAERERRKQVLDTRAQVNIAEGNKEKMILLSEGELQAQLNQAAGVKQRIILESEGHLQSAINQGQAIARQVELLAQTMAGESPRPTDANYANAAELLIKIKRIEQLKAVANGPGNATYFFGEGKGSPGSQNAYDVDNAERWKAFLREQTGKPSGAIERSVSPPAAA